MAMSLGHNKKVSVPLWSRHSSYTFLSFVSVNWYQVPFGSRTPISGPSYLTSVHGLLAIFPFAQDPRSRGSFQLYVLFCFPSMGQNIESSFRFFRCLQAKQPKANKIFHYYWSPCCQSLPLQSILNIAARESFKD